MEYGEEDDDPEDTSEESPNGKSSVAAVRKPFWALWPVLVLWIIANEQWSFPACANYVFGDSEVQNVVLI